MFLQLTKRTAVSSTGERFVETLPAGWTLSRLNNIGTFTKGRGGSRQDDDVSGLACIRYGDLYKLDRPVIRKPVTRIAVGSAPAYTQIKRGDVLFALSGESKADIGKSAVCLIDEPTYCGGDTAIFSPSPAVIPDFLGHALTVPYTVEQKSSFGRGDIIVHVTVGALKQLMIAVPPLEEQAAIVKYLGHAHSRIDRAIIAKRKLIALLEEQKQAIIHQAVTRGLNPSASLKDSGVPWLDKIPANWEVCRAKYLFKEFDIRSGTGSERLLSLRAIAGLVFHDEVSDRVIGPEVLAKYKKVCPGHLVMNRMRAAVGLFAIAETEGLVSPDYSTMEVSKAVDARFYLRLFKTRAAMTEFRQQSSGLGTGESGFMRLYSESFGRIPLPMPPLPEQAVISEELAAIEQDSSEITARASKEIELLREFRTRLTSDVVTGRVDVREIAATLPELSEVAPPAADDDFGSDGDLIESVLEFTGADE